MGFDLEDILFGGIFGLILSLFLGPIFWAKGLFIRKPKPESIEAAQQDVDGLKEQLNNILNTEPGTAKA